MVLSTLASAHANLYEALNHMLSGEKGAILAAWSKSPDASYAGPFGGFILGGDAIAVEYAAVADSKLLGRIEVTDLRMIEGADLGYTICTEHGIDHVINGETVQLKHRATNVFRRENGDWKLLHHHTDPQA